MVLPPSIDPGPYLQPPRVTVRSGLSLSKMLLRVVPIKPGPGVLTAAKLLRLAVTDLDGKWKANKKAKRAKDVRPLDVHLDRIWTIVENSLSRYTALRAKSANRKRAAALYDELFSEGLDFLRLRYLEEHAESQRRLDMIKDMGLRGDLEELVGKEFIDELHAAHKAYGDALGITKPGEAAEAGPLLEPLRTVQRAIGGYTLQVLAFAGVDPDNIPAAKRALEPIDKFRAAAKRAAAEGGSAGPSAGADDDGEDDVALPEDAPDPEDEVPELPEE